MASVRGISASILAGTSVGAMGYAYNKTTQGGYVDKSKGVGVGAVGIGIGAGAYKIARGGGKSLSNAEYARRGASAIEKTSGRFKKGGIGLAAMGVGGAAYSAQQFQQGDYGQAAMGAGVSAVGIAGASGMLGAMSKANKVSGAIRQSLDAADTAMEASRKLSNRADAFRGPRNFGYGTIAAGALTMAGGMQNGSMGTMAAGAGIMAIGGGIAAVGRNGVARNMAKSSTARRTSTSLEKGAAGLARRAENFGTTHPGNLVKASGAVRKADKALSESVTLLRKSRAGYGAAGIAAFGAVTAGILGHSIGLF
jgi:hypothetical protein